MDTKSPAKPAPLGRGLSALFGDADASYQAKAAPVRLPAEDAQGTKPRGQQTLPTGWLQPGAFQPRRHFDEEALNGLSASIAERGIMEPLIVRPIKDHKDMYEIIAGERRWRAAQMAKLHEVPVVIRDLTDREALEFGLIENVQRQDLSPLEEAEGYKRLIDEFDHSQEKLAVIVGKSRPHIANMLRLLTLPAGVKQMIDQGKLSLGHARAVITAKDPMALANEIVKKGLNVRQAEALVKRAAENPEIHKPKAATPVQAAVHAIEKDIERAIGMKVKITQQGKGGTFTIMYHDLDQLDGIIKKLRG